MMRLSKEVIEPLVQKYFDRREAYLRLLDHEDSPLYVFDPSVLTQRANQFRRAFMEHFPDGRFYFAVKSNNHPDIAETVLKSGFGLDVSSGKELTMALTVGGEDILLTGPGKTAAELTLAVENAGKVTILLDSFHELQKVESIAAAKGVTIRAGVRISTNPIGLWRKFGIPVHELLAFFKKAADCPHVHLQGLQFHTSWNLSPRAQTDFIGLLGAELATCPAALLKTIQFLDIGGGYWPQPGEWLHQEGSIVHHPAAPIATFAEALSAAIRKDLSFLSPCRIYCEPGRWICNDSMNLLMTIVDQKASDLVITDAGINAVGWERYETDYFPILNLTRPSLEEKSCNICGSLCTPHDLFGFSYFGEDLCIGDVLLIPCQGAYTYSLRQDFIKPIPRVVSLFQSGDNP